jgi:NAD(P)-dependent dehydrogenase (short-subunit alcohol dehydrogenase family)
MAQKIWLITGISRGLGRAMAQAALLQGNVVIGTSRSGTADLSDKTSNLRVLPLEVTNREQAFSTVAAAHEINRSNRTKGSKVS